MRFQNKVILISGGTKGIGKATAHMFAEQGGILALIYKSDKNNAEKALSHLPGSGHKIFQCDIADGEAIQNTVNDIHSKFGRIDILINNAAFHENHPIDKCSYEEWQTQWQKTLQVNLIGTANLTFCVSQKMIENRDGRIVFVSSRGAFRGEPDMPAYGASKAGINAMAQSLAKKLAPHGIYIGVVAPGFVATDLVKDVLEGERGPSIKAQSPLNRVAKPEEIAHAILFFADEKSVWSTGAILDINGASYLRT